MNLRRKVLQLIIVLVAVFGLPVTLLVVSPDGPVAHLAKANASYVALWHQLYGSDYSPSSRSVASNRSPSWRVGNGFTWMTFQGDSNLVIYCNESSCNPHPVAVWASNTSGVPSPSTFWLQSDGNLVVYDRDGRARWASNHYGGNGSWYVLFTSTGCFNQYHWVGGGSGWGYPVWQARSYGNNLSSCHFVA